MVWNKLIGIGLFGLGFLIIVGFPSVDKYQPERMSKAGVIIGLILAGIGLYLFLS